MRWIVLALVSMVVFANYYLYDCFSTLKGEHRQKKLRFRHVREVGLRLNRGLTFPWF
jgi:hypothetical protein